MPSPAKSETQELQTRLANLKGSLQWSNLITAAVGILGLCMAVFYSSYAYSEISSFAEPENVVMMVDDLLTSNLTSTRKTLQDQIKGSAPEWAGLLSTQARESIPLVRENLEKYALEALDKQVSEIEVLTEQEFRGFVLAHKKDFEQSVQALAAGDERLSDEKMDDLVAILDAEYGLSFQQRTRELFNHLINLNKKLVRLKANKDLTAEEKLEREIVMQMRAIEKRETAKNLPSDTPDNLTAVRKKN